MNSTITYAQTLVELDDLGPYPALVENERRWNGFAVAWFTRETMREIANKVADWVRDPDIDGWIQVTDDGFVEHDCDGLTPLEERDIEGVRYFSVCWCWSEAETNA